MESMEDCSLFSYCSLFFAWESSVKGRYIHGDPCIAEHLIKLYPVMALKTINIFNKLAALSVKVEE